MPTIRVDLKDLSKKFDEASEEIKAAMVRGLESGVMRGQVIVMKESPVDTGLYRSSWQTQKIADGHMQLGNSAPHAPAIEFGTRPHKPPLAPLLAWAKRVLKDPSQPPNYSAEVRGLAVGVQKKIEREGQAPRHVLTNAIPKIIDAVNEEVKRELNGVG